VLHRQPPESRRVSRASGRRNFTHDLGRKILEILEATDGRRIELGTLGKELANRTNDADENYDSRLFLPTSRLPDKKIGFRRKEKSLVIGNFRVFRRPGFGA
jgi:hypothetical protein